MRVWISTALIELSVVLYVLVALAILAVVLGAVVVRSWRIANENPVKSIKSE